MKLIVASGSPQFELVRRALGLAHREARFVRFPYDVRGAAVEQIIVAEPCLAPLNDGYRYELVLDEVRRIEARDGKRAQRVRT